MPTQVTELMKAERSRQLANSSQNKFLQSIYLERIALGWADVLTGFAISGALNSANIQLLMPTSFILLIAATMSGAGAILARSFSVKVSNVECWQKNKLNYILKDKDLFSLGVLFVVLIGVSGIWLSPWAALFAVAIAISAVCHSLFAREHSFYGLVSFALYRASSILLGVSIVSTAWQQRWYVTLIPIIYLAIAILYSQKKFEESTWRTELPIVLTILVVFESLFLIYTLPGYDIFKTLLFVIILARQILPPYFKSVYEPTPETIATATNAFWTGIFLLDATIAAGFSNWYYALLVLFMLPIARSAIRLTSNIETNTHTA